MSPPTPPRYVPTLTEVVEVVEVLPMPQAAQPPESAPLPTPAPAGAGAALDQAAIAAEVMRQITPALEARLRDAASALLSTPISKVLPGLQQHIENAVQHAIAHAAQANNS